MFENLTLRNFRGIENLRLDGLGRVNLVIGPNGAAKTSLLHAVFLLCAETNSEQVFHLIKPEAGKQNSSSMERALRWWIHRKEPDSGTPRDTEGVAEFEASARGQQRKVRLKLWRPSIKSIELANQAGSEDGNTQAAPRVGRRSSEDVEKQRRLAQFLLTLETLHADRAVGELEIAFVPGGEVVFRQSEGQSQIPAVIVHANSYTGRESPDLPLLVSAAEAMGRLEAVVEFLRSFDPEIDALRVAAVADNQSVTRVLHRRLGMVPIALFGDGFVAACSTLLGVLTLGPRVALIDEFDSRLHVGVVRRMIPLLLELAQTQDTQIFLTSHRQDSVESLAALPREDLAAVRVIQMARHEGAIRGQVIPGDAVQRLVSELGLDLRQPT